MSDLDARNSATAADVERGFSVDSLISGSPDEVGGFSVGNCNSSESR